jgi:hypothetical protein
VRSLDWRTTPATERWRWWQQLWCDVCELRMRYELPVRTDWWTHSVQLEALAALAAWISTYDDGEWDDPPGKLSLLLDLDRIAALLRDGGDPFYPDRDRPAFERYLQDIGCQPPATQVTPLPPFQER